MKDFIMTIKALSDPNRVKIVKMLQHRVMCVCEIGTALKITQPGASKHLKILENAGFISSQKDGMWINYRISDGGSSPYVASLLGNLRHWMEDDPDIAEILERLPYIQREEICRKV
jgi:ArsR family transcriptional regulator